MRTTKIQDPLRVTGQSRRDTLKRGHRAARFMAVGFLMFASMAATAARGAEMVVPSGSSKQIPVPEGVKKIAVANPAIVDAKPTPDGKAVMVTGVSEGTSEVRIEQLEGTQMTYKIHVHGDIQEEVNEINELIADIEGL